MPQYLSDGYILCKLVISIYVGLCITNAHSHWQCLSLTVEARNMKLIFTNWWVPDPNTQILRMSYCVNNQKQLKLHNKRFSNKIIHQMHIRDMWCVYKYVWVNDCIYLYVYVCIFMLYIYIYTGRCLFIA